ncbi:MAG: VCBS repeat-containing protein, partial [Planctomycetaceae bacterium]|nr:VCBS repeat-containing protein [Planctomycetaceae bacterium]
MVLCNWLSGLKFTPPGKRSSRRTRRRSPGHPQPLEIRTLLSAVSFTQQTGSSNPLNGFDVGQYSSPTMGDLDGDGDLDVIVGLSNGTFKYYKNTGTAIAPVFTEQTGTDNPLNGVDVGSFSIPTLVDLDGDGDLDLVTGNDDGTFNYFRNTGTALAPVFTEQTFSNNPLNGFDLGDSSAPALGDLDGDGDLDLISGAFNGKYFYYLNTGTAKSPSFTEQTGAANPLNGKDVGFSSVPQMADVDGDGDLDVIAGENSGNFKYYLNTGTAIAPVFVELTGAANPLNGKSVDSNSTPAFGDLDGDGDVDLVSGEFSGNLKYFLNTTVPVDDIGFTSQTGTDNPLNGEDVGSLSLQVLGDLDGDGDLDLIAGNSQGTLDYFKNTGTAIAPVYAKQTGANNPLDGVYLGFTTAPALGDLDGDGDLDLIVGNLDGQFTYYKNTGSAISPVFVSQTGSNNPLDGFDVGTDSAPTLGDLDGDGDLDLIVGNLDGTFKYYKNTGTAKAPVLVDQTGSDNPLNGVDVGDWSTPALGDVDGDGDLDLVVGEQDGTFIYYKNTGTATAPVFVSQTGSNNPLNGKDA